MYQIENIETGEFLNCTPCFWVMAGRAHNPDNKKSQYFPEFGRYGFSRHTRNNDEVTGIYHAYIFQKNEYGAELPDVRLVDNIGQYPSNTVIEVDAPYDETVRGIMRCKRHGSRLYTSVLKATAGGLPVSALRRKGQTAYVKEILPETIIHSDMMMVMMDDVDEALALTVLGDNIAAFYDLRAYFE